MNKFDNLIMDGMINVSSMLEARRKVLKQRQDAGFDVSHELQRAKRFSVRYAGFVRDWQYWYYDDVAGQGDGGPRSDASSKGEVEVQHGLPSPVGKGDRKMKKK